MPFLGGFIKDKPKTAGELVAKAVASLEAVTTAVKEKQVEKAVEDVDRYFNLIKQWLFGDDTHEPTKENAIAVAMEACNMKLPSLLVNHIAELGFESRKDSAQIFGAIVRIKDLNDTPIGALHVRDHDILDALVDGYDNANIALNCGSMLRDCLRDEALSKLVLTSPKFWSFFEKVEVANFEIASDAFSTFKDLLIRHKPMVAQFLADNYQEFFDRYNQLLKSENYVTRRQSLKLLAEILLEKPNVKVMVRYVADVGNLMLMMNLLKDQSRSIQFEAFHVFKVFVANPSKPQGVVDILCNNRGKLLRYLEDFHTDKDEDEQFKDEKAVIIKEISRMGQQTQPEQQAGSSS